MVLRCTKAFEAFLHRLRAWAGALKEDSELVTGKEIIAKICETRTYHDEKVYLRVRPCLLLRSVGKSQIVSIGTSVLTFSPFFHVSQSPRCDACVNSQATIIDWPESEHLRCTDKAKCSTELEKKNSTHSLHRLRVSSIPSAS